MTSMTSVRMDRQHRRELSLLIAQATTDRPRGMAPRIYDRPGAMREAVDDSDEWHPSETPTRDGFVFACLMVIWVASLWVLLAR